MTWLKDFLAYFVNCDLNNYKTLGHDNLQQSVEMLAATATRKYIPYKNADTAIKKSNKGVVISMISSKRKKWRHISIKTKENLSTRWPSITEIHGINPAATTAGASDVDSNCATTDKKKNNNNN
ncbi:hypothetical protein PoB_003629100 [Plakobranchus ocellatus]|uniref:Uncharacterized protein n=1 Tax=Plakobranchus ocellatus TaxID=259542 RepID=A0AAV4ANN7_9GAST|nr:hypothetical protein PoB_003629100 [Plakobranchus ocellatus]